MFIFLIPFAVKTAIEMSMGVFLVIAVKSMGTLSPFNMHRLLQLQEQQCLG